MKSENAKEYITHATCTAQEYAERFGGRELVVSRWDVCLPLSNSPSRMPRSGCVKKRLRHSSPLAYTRMVVVVLVGLVILHCVKI